MFKIGLLFAVIFISHSIACARDVHIVTLQDAEKAVLATDKKIVTFIGYSAAEYENENLMLANARDVLKRFDPKTTIVNIGASPEGIGHVYKLAKEMGFETTGIESTLAVNRGRVSEYVDHVFFIKDTTWGGFKPGTHELSPTSKAMVDVSNEVIGIGGNEVGRDELIASREAGKSVKFFPAEMNHDLAIAKAAQKGLRAPTTFTGAAQEGLAKMPVNLGTLKKPSASAAALLSGHGCMANVLRTLLAQ